MNRTARIAASLLVAVAAPPPAQAADKDVQLWVFANTIVPLGERANATLELSPRFFREGGDQLVTRGSVNFSLSDTLTMGGGGAYVEFAGGHELRAEQQLTLTKGRLALRTRFEQRFFDGSPRPQLRLRQRIQAAWPVASGTRLTGSAELLYIARPENARGKARIDSWRGNLAVQRKLTPRLDAALGYLLIYSPRADVPDRVSHVPQVTVTFRP